MVRKWLGKDGIIFCGHNVLYWIPFLKKLGAIKSPLVSLLYAREPLDLASAHTGIITLTPAGAEHAKKLAPRAKSQTWAGALISAFSREFPIILNGFCPAALRTAILRRFVLRPTSAESPSG